MSAPVPVYVDVEDAPWRDDDFDGPYFDKIACLKVGRYTVLEVPFYGGHGNDCGEEAASEIADALQRFLKGAS